MDGDGGRVGEWVPGTTGARIIDLMFTLNAESGTTLILVTHDVELARRCGRILHLIAGRLIS